MSNTKKVPVNKDDYERIVLTETIPIEIPIIFSTVGFYGWLRRHLKNSKAPKIAAREKATSLARHFAHPSSKFCRPLKYKIAVDAARTRELSLIHPRSQASWVEFYREFNGLLVHACRRSSCSMRAPVRPARHVFFSNSSEDRNRLRLVEKQVDTEEQDATVKHPASFFAYRGFRRLYEFFDSPEFIGLEKKYGTMWMLDVSNCFGSIYTHSVSWAVKSKEFVKSQIQQVRQSFSGEFERVMQDSNWKETNGIVVGPEISRLFAEIILQDVDVATVRSVAERDVTTFELKRYVDDYFVFANSDQEASVVAAELEAQLWKYNLTLNASKTRKYSRPFITSRSAVITRVRALCRSMRDLLVESSAPMGGQDVSGVPVGSRLGVGTPAPEFAPRSAHVWREAGVSGKAPGENARVPSATLRGPSDRGGSVATESATLAERGIDDSADKLGSRVVPRRFGPSATFKLSRTKCDFLRDLKTLCRELESGYDLVALYVNSTLDRLVSDVCRGEFDKTREDDYRELLLVILDLMFFFYCVQPSVASSLCVANASLLALRALKQSDFKDSVADVEQSIFESCWTFLGSAAAGESQPEGASIERLNVVSIMSQLQNHVVPWDVLRGWITGNGKPDRLGYFQLIVGLHYAHAKREDPAYGGALSELEEIIRRQIAVATERDVVEDTRVTCLTLDVLSCPFLSDSVRREVLEKACRSVGISRPASPGEADRVLKVFARSPWFVKWDEVELFSALERKRRTTVY